MAFRYCEAKREVEYFFKLIDSSLIIVIKSNLERHFSFDHFNWWNSVPIMVKKKKKFALLFWKKQMRYGNQDNLISGHQFNLKF